MLRFPLRTFGVVVGLNLASLDMMSFRLSAPEVAADTLKSNSTAGVAKPACTAAAAAAARRCEGFARKLTMWLLTAKQQP
jgi:hypothetical protein